jgi:hypothetical protein
LQREAFTYLVEFDFRYSNRDYSHAEIAVKRIFGRRLTYRRPNSKNDAAPNEEACEAPFDLAQ